ncbi:neuronal acetylcholine receptor subunit alpha-9-like [Dreissena polymorpha]|uniref:Uncharacterized protein n=1 Tax=Dreissena polymorpha TaxID=45954 RepID=A0A9D4S265_DREPO|nr:neuronal acetylcholine receptor subunit alpha-9-like [Dreissena polymorpha]KAH3887775.1 hypothetical protein DPMN_011794 [Dreissena polymorpha]
MYVTVFSNMHFLFVRLMIFQWSMATCYVASQTADDVKNLTIKLFKTDEYSKIVRPLKDQSQSVKVFTELILNTIIDFDERDENLKISCWLSISWHDECLKWEPEDYGGLTFLALPQNDTWRPDIRLHNSFRTFTGLGSSNVLLRVSYIGMVLWEPYQILEATCEVDITYFPFDTQECPLKFSAWSYNNEEVEIIEGLKGIYLDEFEENSRWSMVDTTSDSETNDGFVIFKMKMKRKSTFYVFYILIPIVLLSFLNVITFALPLSSGERASYAITVILSLALFLTIVASEIPKNSDTIPVISVYITAILALSTANVITSLLESRMASRDKNKDPIAPGYMTLYRLARICQCKRNGKSHPEQDIEWKDVVAVVDYFLFWLFFVLTFITTVVWFVIANRGGQSE